MSNYRVFTLYKGGTKVYVGYARDEDSMYSFALKYKMEYSSIIAGRHFESKFDAVQEVEKIVGKFQTTYGEFPKYNKHIYIRSTNGTARCYLCGIRESTTARLIEGAHGLVCISCMDNMISSMIDQDGPEYFQAKVLTANGLEWFERSITFPPEFRQSGISILHYFSEVVGEKYPQQDVHVKIEQKGSIVRLIVQTTQGTTETIERELERYGMVVMGKIPVEEFGLSDLGKLALKNELRLAQTRIESQREMMLLQTEHIEKQSDRIDTLFELLGTGLKGERGKDISVTVKPVITMSPYQIATTEQKIVSNIRITDIRKFQERLSELQQIHAGHEKIENAIRAINLYINEKGTIEDVKHSLAELKSSPQEARSFLNRISELGESVIVGAAGSGFWELISGVLRTLIP